MAANGINSFYINCVSSDDLNLVEAICGRSAFFVYARLRQHIHSTEGYYCRWNEKLAALFYQRYFDTGCGFDIKYIECVVREAVAQGVFDKEKFDLYGILTSVEIQENYIKASARRRSIAFKSEYILDEMSDKFDKKDRTNVSENEKATEKFQEKSDDTAESEDCCSAENASLDSKKADKDGLADNECNVKDEKLHTYIAHDVALSEKLHTHIAERKGKEIKGNEIKKESEGRSLSLPTLAPCGMYNNVKLTLSELDRLKDKYPGCYLQYIDELSSYIESTGKKYTSHYATLLRWIKEGEKKRTAAEDKAAKSDKPKQYKNAFNDFTQREYSEEEFREIIKRKGGI